MSKWYSFEPWCHVSIAVCLLAILVACKPDETADSNKFSVVDEEVSESPVKTQITQHILALDIPTESELESEVLGRYRAAAERSGFQHHSSATNIYIYVYGSEEQARAGQGLWIAMLAKINEDASEPKVVITESRLTALSAAPEERFGLSENVRKDIFRESGEAEARATREAMNRIQDTKPMEQIDLERELSDTYKAVLIAKHGITAKHLLKIQVEGVEKGWPTQ